MKRLRYLVPILGLTSLVAVACTAGTDDPVEGDAGAGGEAAGGSGPGPMGGGGGEETGSGGGCAEEGTGKLVIDVSGLPAGVDPDILIEGPGPALAPIESGDLENVDAGDFTVTAPRVFDTDAIVRTVYEPTVNVSNFCLADGASQTIEVSYAAIPSSNKLWMPTDLDDEIAGFSSFAIAESGITDATVDIDGPGSKSLAFDRDGNMWAVGPTTADPKLVRFAAAALGESGTLVPDITIDVKEIECSFWINHIAFDGDGNLWLSACGDQVHRIAADDLTSSGDKVSDAIITGSTANEGIAFDADGNLWVAGGGVIGRYDQARLGESDGDPPDLSLTVAVAAASNGTGELNPTELAFDAQGNLWGVSSSEIFQIAVAALGDTGDQAVEAKTTFSVEVLALPAGLAFDDSGSLWVGVVGGTFGGFSKTQLGMSSGTGAPVTPAISIQSDSVASGLPIAFFPAAEGLPLYHALPVP